MLNDEFFSNFLKKCLIETSLFNPRHAMDDPDWIKISQIFNNAKIKQDAVENPIPTDIATQKKLLPREMAAKEVVPN